MLKGFSSGRLFTFCVMVMISLPAYAAKCADVKTQQQAQAYFIKYGDKRLDRDKDGRACDCLPGGNGQKCPGKSRLK